MSNFQLTDTCPDIHKKMIEGYRKMSPLEKLMQVDEMTKAVQQLALMRIKKQYKGISEHEQRLRLASLWLDRDTMIRIFGWDPRREGY